MARLTFVIVTHNSGDVLADCLHSLPRRDDVEAIVVDNASSDDSRAIVGETDGVQLVALDENVGFGAGANCGAERASGDVLVVLNPDARLHPGYEDVVLDRFDTEPDLGILGCRVLDPNGVVQRTCNRFPTLGALLHDQSGLGRLRPNSQSFADFVYADWDRESARDVDSVYGACMAVRRDAFESAGRFDPGYFLFYEEFDLARRVRAQGYRAAFTPHATCTHFGQTSTGKVHGAAIDAIYYASRDRYIRSYHGRGTLYVFKALALAFNKLAGLRDRMR